MKFVPRLPRRALFALMVGAFIGTMGISHISPTQAQEGPAKFPAHGEIKFQLPTLTSTNRSATSTMDSPIGPITVTATLSDKPAALDAEGKALTLSGGSRTCSVGYTIPTVAWFGIENDFTYDYNSVTWMSYIRNDHWAVPLWGVDDVQTWTTWWSGIQYAYADGQADLTYGWPISMMGGPRK